MIRDKRRQEQWQNVSSIDLGPGQYTPYTSTFGSKYNFTEKEPLYKIESGFPQKKVNVSFGTRIDRFSRFIPVNMLPDKQAKEQNFVDKQTLLENDLQNTLKKQIKLDEKSNNNSFSNHSLMMQKRRSHTQIFGGSERNSPRGGNKIQTGLAIVNKLQVDKVPSIPFEPRDVKTEVQVGPGSYNPNIDSTHKKLPKLTFSTSSYTPHGPKRALEQYISNIFQNSIKGINGVNDLNHERVEDDFNAFRGKKVKLGLVLPAKTEPNSPIRDLNNETYQNKPKPQLVSQIKPPGPGFYNHHINEFGSSLRKEYYSNKKISFGSNDPRKFTINRSLESPFFETSQIENPPAWKYQKQIEAGTSKNLLKLSPSMVEQQPVGGSFGKESGETLIQKNIAKRLTPGPGQYDIDFQEELKILDQKLSIRYHLGPFGSTEKRFKPRSKDVIESHQNLMVGGSQDIAQNQEKYNLTKKQEMRKYMDEAIDLIKSVQNNKETSAFKSGQDRFKDPKLNYTVKEISEDERKEQVLNRLMGSNARHQSQPANPIQKQRPFDSSSPRFNFKKQEVKEKGLPGPGHYGTDYETQDRLKKIEVSITGTIDKKYVPTLGIENRQKHSLFGQVTKQGLQTPVGPGSYNIASGSDFTLKKSFNTSLSKKLQ
eukprot:403343838